jgi:hypothetical protein
MAETRPPFPVIPIDELPDRKDRERTLLAYELHLIDVFEKVEQQAELQLEIARQVLGNAVKQIEKALRKSEEHLPYDDVTQDQVQFFNRRFVELLEAGLNKAYEAAATEMHWELDRLGDDVFGSGEDPDKP